MRADLGPVVEPEHRLDDPVEFARHRDQAGPAAIAAAVELELVEVDAEGAIEARDRSRQHHGAPRRIRLHDGETVSLGKFLDRCQIEQRSPELPSKVGTTDVGLRQIAGGELRHLCFEGVGVLAAHQHRDLEALRRILPGGACSRNWLPDTAGQNMGAHGDSPSRRARRWGRRQSFTATGTAG
jgi:hypothetical protein